MAIELNGDLADWTPADRLEKEGLGAPGHEIYGRFEAGKFLIGIKAPEAIGAGTTFWLNTDRDATTGKLVFGSTVGADYYVNFDPAGLPWLYDGLADAVIGSVTFARSADGTVLEFELPKAQLGGGVGVVTFTGDINDSTHLTSDYALGGFTVTDPSVNPLDGLLTEWTRADRIETAANAQSGYEVYGKAEGDAFHLALNSPIVIGSQTTFWLNTDQNAATGAQVFGNPTGSDFRIEVDAGGIARLYTGAGNTPIAPLNSMLGPDQKTIEITLPKSLVGDSDRLDIYLDVNQTAFIPGAYASAPPLTLVDTSASQHPESGMQKIAIVYSETTAARFFSTMAYSQLFMAAQSQAMAAGIPFDVISEADLTDLSKLSQYDALVFPSFRNVPANYEAVAEALTRLIYDYDVSLITAGDFMTNDAAGNALPGNAYARMDLLFGIHRTGGASGPLTIVATADGHPVTEGYAAGSVIHQYDTVIYSDGSQSVPSTSFFAASNANYAPTTTIAAQTVNGSTHDADIGTETGSRNVHFATESLLADSNLLGKALDWVTNPISGPTVSLHMSRNSAMVASRNDMDQSQESYDVDGLGNNDVGIYDVLLPILQTWKDQYNFVGSYYVNVGLNPPDQETNWLISAEYYDALLAMGNEIGSHSYTHPSNTNFLAGVIDSDAKLTAFKALYMAADNTDFDPALGAALSDMTLAQYTAGLNAALASNDPAGLNAIDKALLATTFKFQFETSRQVIETNLGISLTGAAVPGMPEGLDTARQIIQFYDYLSGGASLVGAGYPGAFGYLSAADDNKIYLAPNMSFDFTLMGWQDLTIEQAKAAWTAEWQALNANSDLPIAVWPWHDYGPTEWIIDAPAPSDYKLEMFTHFIQTAYNSGAEFVTLSDLAARMATFEKTAFSFAVAGDVITATATPQGASIGTFALNLDDLDGKTIKSVVNWYAYDENSVYLDEDGGQFQIQLGTAPDDVTHITKLDSRMTLKSINGDGTKLSFTVVGEGLIQVALKDYLGSPFAVTGATVVSQVGDLLTLKLDSIPNSAVLPSHQSHTVSIDVVDRAPTAINVSGQIVLAENTVARTLVATLDVVDPDLDPRLNNNVVLVSDDRFVFDQTDKGLHLQAGKTIDYEAGQYIDLVLTAGSGSPVTKNIQISIGDVDEAPTEIVVSNQIVLAENTVVRTKIADLSVIDPDTAAAFRNNVVSVSDGRFEFADGAIFLKAGQAINFEAEPTINLVLATGPGNTVTKNLLLSIDDVSEFPTSIVFGTAGADTLTGNSTAETFYAGAGDDIVNAAGGADLVYGEAGDDHLFGGDGDDRLFGGDGDDRLFGGDGDDRLFGGLGSDYLNGGSGRDYADYSHDTSGLTASLHYSGWNVGAATGDTYSDVEGLLMGSGNDVGYGDKETNYIYAEGGNDTIFGLDGRDFLFGQDGNDNLIGGDGNDHLFGGLGADLLQGGNGFDYARYDDSNYDGILIALGRQAANTGVAAGDSFMDIEGFVLSSGNDVVYGNSLDNIIYGRGGNDTLYGKEGHDTLFGEEGNDRFIFDTQVSSTNSDIIGDFVSGTDKIGLSHYFYGAADAGGAEIRFFQGAGVTGAAVHAYLGAMLFDTATSILSYDPDGAGSGGAIQIATLTNVNHLIGSDFFFV